MRTCAKWKMREYQANMRLLRHNMRTCAKWKISHHC